MNTSLRNGQRTSKKHDVHVENITELGVWVHLAKHEYFLDYDHFPWFKRATVEQICRVELIGDDHLHWPQLDVDLEFDSIRNPEKYPLIYR